MEASYETDYAPAVAVLETSSIARGVVMVDALLKKAHVKVLMADPVTPGKYTIVFVGPVGEVEESFAVAREVANTTLVDSLMLPHAHPAILPAINAQPSPLGEGALGVLELLTVASTFRAVDKALKTAEVTLLSIHLARGVGGKGYFTIEGSLDQVDAAIEAGDAEVSPEHRAGREVIARPHDELAPILKRL